MAKLLRHRIRPNGSAEFRTEGTTFRIITGRRFFGGNPPPESLEVNVPEGYEFSIATADVAAKTKEEKAAARAAAREIKAKAKEEKKANKLAEKQKAAAAKEEAKRLATEAAKAKSTDAPAPQPSI
jgi:hypothetical protein